MSTRLQWAMLFLLLCICAPPLLAFWVKNVGTTPSTASMAVLVVAAAALVCYLLWRRLHRG